MTSTEPWHNIDSFLLYAMWSINLLCLIMFGIIFFGIILSVFGARERLVGVRTILHLVGVNLPVQKYTLPPVLLAKVRQDTFQRAKKSTEESSQRQKSKRFKSVGATAGGQQSLKLAGFKTVPIETKLAITKSVKASVAVPPLPAKIKETQVANAPSKKNKSKSNSPTATQQKSGKKVNG